MVYIPDQAALRYFKGWQGPVGRDLIRRGRTLEFRARNSAGIDTGRLRADIETRRKDVTDGIEIQVGSWNIDWALVHHEGSRPHVILPRRAPRLVFRVNGRIVFAKRVNHPGTRPNSYLSRWLREAVR